MVSHIKFTEKRCHRRYKLRNNVMAALRPGSIKAGQITDISRSGLSFSYYHKGKATIEPTEMDILLPDFTRGIFLRNLAIKTVWDTFLSKSPLFGSAPIRKQGVVFEKLNSTQISDLERFIRSYSAGNDIGNHFSVSRPRISTRIYI